MRKYTKEQLIYYLKKLAKELKKTPTIKEMNSRKEFPSASTYVKRFNSWNNALKKAGLTIARKKYTKEELIENLKLLAKQLKRVPKTTDLRRKWIPSYSTYRKHFKNWKHALKSAELVNEFFDLRRVLKKQRKQKV